MALFLLSYLLPSIGRLDYEYSSHDNGKGSRKWNHMSPGLRNETPSLLCCLLQSNTISQGRENVLHEGVKENYKFTQQRTWTQS